MKEALVHTSSWQQKILEAYEESPFRYFSNTRRRGYIPKNINQGMPQEMNIYPFTTFGCIERGRQGIRERGIGAIIHKNLIISANSNFPLQQQQADIWFTPFCSKSEKYRVRRIHPSILQRKLRNSHPQGDDTKNRRCLIFQIDTKEDLQTKYGSLGINFTGDQYSSKLVLLGIYSNEDQYKIKEEKTNISILNNRLTYRISYSYLPGSLIVNQRNGQYQIVGMHFSSNERKGQGVSLTKQVLKQFNKMTYKGGYLDLYHENLGHKCISFLSQLNLKKMKHLQLQNASLGIHQLKMIANLKCQLNYLSIGFNRINDDALTHLADTQWPLQTLSLTRNPLTSEAVRMISKIKWRNLIRIDLNLTQIGSKGTLYLIQGDWINLQTLNLRSALIDDFGCEKLRKGVWPHLTCIQLDHNKIMLQGVRFLGNANWKKLQNLSLTANPLRLQGSKQLVRGDWRKIKSIRAGNCKQQRNGNRIKTFIRDKFKLPFIIL